MSFTAATETKGLHDMAFWIGKASSVLASLLHAAALDGRTMTEVYRWAHGIDDTEPEQILAAHPAAAEGWLGPIREMARLPAAGRRSVAHPGEHSERPVAGPARPAHADQAGKEHTAARVPPTTDTRVPPHTRGISLAFACECYEA